MSPYDRARWFVNIADARGEASRAAQAYERGLRGPAATMVVALEHDTLAARVERWCDSDEERWCIVETTARLGGWDALDELLEARA